MNSEELIAKAPVNSGEELYSTLNHVKRADAERIETDLPGEVKVTDEGLIHYRGPVEMSAVVGDVTAARDEASEVYWLTDGEQSYWIDSQGELNQGENHRLEQLHRLGQTILEPENEEDIHIQGQQPGLFTSGPLQYIPEGRKEKLRHQVEQGEKIEMTEYAGHLNEDRQETAESMARELNKVLKRKPGYEKRDRKGTELR